MVAGGVWQSWQGLVPICQGPCWTCEQRKAAVLLGQRGRGTGCSGKLQLSMKGASDHPLGTESHSAFSSFRTSLRSVQLCRCLHSWASTRSRSVETRHQRNRRVSSVPADGSAPILPWDYLCIRLASLAWAERLLRGRDQNKL